MSDKFIRRFDADNRCAVMSAAWDASGSLTLDGRRAQVTVEPITRSMEQNARLHAMLADVAAQQTFNGERLSLEQWKMLFVSAHAKATDGDVKMAIGLEGEVVNLRESTAKMSVARCSSLMEYIQAWAAEHGVRFRAKEGWEV